MAGPLTFCFSALKQIGWDPGVPLRHRGGGSCQGVWGGGLGGSLGGDELVGGCESGK